MSDFPGPPDDPSDAEAVFTESKTFKECVRAFDRGDDETLVLKLKELAGSGYAKAQHHLAFMYREGRGTEQNDELAFDWYKLAAEQGHAPAQYNLGLMYGNGRGVPQNYVRAHMWFNLASVNVTGEDHKRHSRARDLVAGLMSSKQITEAKRLAAEWKPKKE